MGRDKSDLSSRFLRHVIPQSIFPMEGSAKENKMLELSGVIQLFKGFADLAALVKLLEAQALDIREIRREITELSRSTRSADANGWIDAKEAAIYLGLSANTFDKYRYQTRPRLIGHKVGGKILYRRSDLDTFVKLFYIKSAGLA